MTSRNVGRADAIVRTVAAVAFAVAGAVLIAMYPLAKGIPLAFACYAVAGLLWNSAVTRECPVHEKLGVDTSK
jgi:uncharacterized membrane protein